MKRGGRGRPFLWSITPARQRQHTTRRGCANTAHPIRGRSSTLLASTSFWRAQTRTTLVP